MHILLLSRYDQLGSSSRLRFYQHLPSLNQSGINVNVAPLLGDDYIRGIYGGKVSKWSIVKAYVARIKCLLSASQYDAVWVEKEMLPWIPAWIELILISKEIKLIVDYDDAVFHRYDQHKLSIVRCLFGHKIDKIMKRANLVVVGNAYLEKRALFAGAKRVAIVPTVVDMTRYAVKKQSKIKVPVIGWIGSPSTTKFLNLIAPALNEVVACRKVKVVAVGANVEQLNKSLFNVLPWSETSEVNDIQDFDIGIMPLPDEPFERGKCGYKLIQYMACGKPVVASPVGVNSKIVQDGVVGYLASTHQDWIAALIKLIDDADLREKMGLAGRTKVETEYSLKFMSLHLADLIRSVVK
jgi:glycosyltransferase involved in cell wall biosynthesis